MIQIHRRLGQEKRRSRLLLQIHDELLIEAPGDELEAIQGLVREEMEGVTQLHIPLKVEIGIGKNWSEAH
jgi:DNA polymerase-1